MLVRLLYASRATGEIDDALVASILERSRGYNMEHGITGIPCTYTEGSVFLQVLEGGRAAVNKLYASIVCDPRHREVTLLDYAEVPERRFASWRMASSWRTEQLRSRTRNDWKAIRRSRSGSIAKRCAIRSAPTIRR